MNRVGTATDADSGDVSLYHNGNKMADGEFLGGQVTFNLDEPLLVKGSEPVSLEVKIDITSDAVKSHVLGVRLDANEGISIDGDLPILTDSNLELKYIEEVSDGIIIDGAFEDWSEVSINIDSDDVQISNHNVDLKEYQITQSSEYLSFCFGVEGKILEGSTAPGRPEFVMMTDSSVNNDKFPTLLVNDDGPNFEPEEIPELVGKDTAHIFIDSDSNPNTGYTIQSLPLGAEYMIEITGKDGIILENGYHIFTGERPMDWLWECQGSVDVGLNAYQLETQLAFEQILIGPDTVARIFFHITDWNNGYDDYSDEYVSDEIETDMMK
jgi:hypothetical protein